MRRSSYPREPPKTPAMWFGAAVLCSLAVAPAVAKEKLELNLQQIELPGAPAKVLPVDLDQDGWGDLVILLAYSEWDQISHSETVEMDQIEGLIEMMTVVPALADRRELRVYLGQPDGSYRELGEPLELDRSVFAVTEGPPGAAPILGLSDEGVSALQLEGEALSWRFLFRTESVLARTGALVSGLELTHDVDGDGVVDLLIPRDNSIAIHLGSPRGLSPTPVSVVDLPGQAKFPRNRRQRHYPWPDLEDVDGDGRSDLLFVHPRLGWERFWVARSNGRATFDSLVAPMGDGEEEALGAGGSAHELRPRDSFGTPEGGLVIIGVGSDGASSSDAPVREEEELEPLQLVHFGDLDGDSQAEYVLLEQLSDPEAGFRKGMKQAKRPPVRYHIFPSNSLLGRRGRERSTFDATGYALFAAEVQEEVPLPGGLQDLDGDGRKDLVAVTLDFSLMQAVRLLATRSLSIGLDFHIWCQREDGSFSGVEGLDLSGKFKLRLADLRLGQLSQFAGDFDGDGRSDFVQMGRGKNVAIHLGKDGCSYSPQPDLVVKLREEPKNLALVRVDDFDQDDLADVLIVQPQPYSSDGASARVRLDLYSSRRPAS